MKTFAIVENGNVVNTVTAISLDSAQIAVKPGQECVEFVVPEIGDSYIDSNFIKIEREPVELSWAMQ
jgi:hypothetical protein